MSTSTEPNGLPDISSLAELANQLFKGLPFGAGATPAPAQSFDIKDPQVSLPDPHFSDGKVPNALAGSGRSSPVRTTVRDSAPGPLHEHLPGLNDPRLGLNDPLLGLNDHQLGLDDVLAGIRSLPHIPQIPFPTAGDPSFYFLKEANPLRVLPEVPDARSGFTVPVSGHTGLSQPPFDVELIKIQ